MGPPANGHNLDRLVSSHLPETLRFATRLTGDPDTAEEIVQEALTRGARSWKTYRQDAPFRTWLFRIVINTFRDHLRSRRTAEGLTADIHDPGAQDPSQLAEAAELSRLIAAQVSALPPRQREVLVLHTYEGLSASEVADLLAISPSNVYATLHVARQRLKEQLAPYLNEPCDERL